MELGCRTAPKIPAKHHILKLSINIGHVKSCSISLWKVRFQNKATVLAHSDSPLMREAPAVSQQHILLLSLHQCTVSSYAWYRMQCSGILKLLHASCASWLRVNRQGSFLSLCIFQQSDVPLNHERPVSQYSKTRQQPRKTGR